MAGNINKMKVLVTDANNRIALAVIRALGENGVKVSSLEQEQFTKQKPICFSSRYVSKRFIIPPISKPEGLSKLLEYAQGHDIILPVSINMILPVVQNRALFEQAGIRVPYPSLDQLKTANSKTKLLELAKDIGIAIPATYHIKDLSELSGLLSKATFPLVIKLPDDEGLYLAPEKRYAIVYDRASFEHAYLKMHRLKQFPLVQEYIQGDGFGFSALLAKSSQALAYFCHKRLRQYPPSGGPSTLCESIYSQPLIDQGLKLLKALNWTGIAMVEFKKDARDNQYKLMEINPRFWGSLPLALHSGVNFPYLLCKMALDENVTPVLKYKTGQKTRFLFLDISSVFSAFTGQNKIPWEFFTDLLDFGIKDGIFSCVDPRPALQYLKNKLYL